MQTLPQVHLDPGPVPVAALEYSLYPHGVGYIRLSVMTRAVPDDLSTALQDLESRGAKGYILDLRGNPGGVILSGRCSRAFLAGKHHSTRAVVGCPHGGPAHSP